MRATGPTAPPAAGEPARWVVAELDHRGTIDAHAAMCLRHAVDGAGAPGSATILVDLRDLTAIEAAGLGLLLRASADCRARGLALDLLICRHGRHDAIADAFAAAGLSYARAARPAAAHSDPPPAGRPTAAGGASARVGAAAAAAAAADLGHR